MKALKTALVVLVTGVALSFASQAKATTDCHPIMLSFWSTNKPYPTGMAPLFDEKCNFVKYIAVSGNVSFVAPMPNATTTTIPTTTVPIVVPVASPVIAPTITLPVSFGGYGPYTPITIPPISWTPSTWKPIALPPINFNPQQSPITLPPISWNTYGTTTRIKPAGYPVINPATRVPSIAVPSASSCVGICYGVPSKVNGLPRNSYVSGYFRANGTWVNPYTRSNP
jgi:hypothetical protein